MQFSGETIVKPRARFDSVGACELRKVDFSEKTRD